MANYQDSQLLIALDKASIAMAQAENKEFTNSSAALLLDNETIFGNLPELKRSIEQPTSALIQKRNVIASGTSKSAAHTGAFGDSFKAPLTWLTRTQTFKISRKIGDNNYFSDQEQLNNRLMNAMYNIKKDINAAILAQLATDRATTATDSLIAFNATNDAFENPDAKRDFLARNVKAAMKKNQYGGQIDIIADQFSFADMVYIANQGAGNQTNLGYQIDSSMRMVEDEQLVDGTYANGALYAFARGLFGMTTWNEYANREGTGSLGSNEGLFTTIADPSLSGIVYDLHAVTNIADSSATNGNPQDIVTEYELAATFCIKSADESTSGQSPIYKFGQLAAV